MRVVLIVVALLALAGCAGTPVDLTPLESPLPEPPSALTSPANIDTVQEGVSYARALTPSTPDLADEISGTIAALTDLVVDADLPSDVNNDIGQRLSTLDFAVHSDPADAADYLPDLRAITDDLSEATNGERPQDGEILGPSSGSGT